MHNAHPERGSTKVFEQPLPQYDLWGIFKVADGVNESYSSLFQNVEFRISPT